MPSREREREGQSSSSSPLACSLRASTRPDLYLHFPGLSLTSPALLLFVEKLFSPLQSIFNMLSSAASSGAVPSRLERLKRWYRSETIDPVKRSCNLVRGRRREAERDRESNQSLPVASKNQSFAHSSTLFFLPH